MTKLKAQGDQVVSPQILCVDDEHAILSSLRRIFRREGYKIITASSSAEALTILENKQIDLLITDMRMPQINGDKLLAEAAIRWPKTPRILLTGYSEIESTNRAESEGDIYCRIDKPWDDDELISKVNEVLHVNSH